MNTLCLTNVGIGYHRHMLRDSIDLTLHQGEIAILLGENGSGKTTLLRTIQGSIPLLDGQLTICDRELTNLSVRERATLVTTMPQETVVLEGMTGMERIEMGFYPTKGLFGRLNDTERERIYQMAADFGIVDLLPRDMATMSAGERQMLSLLRAAVQDTPVLLLDEPTSALDFNHTEKLFALLHHLAAEGKTIFAVVHDPTHALRHGDRILYIDNTRPGIQECAELSNLTQVQAELQGLYPGLQICPSPKFCYLPNATEKCDVTHC